MHTLHTAMIHKTLIANVNLVHDFRLVFYELQTDLPSHSFLATPSLYHIHTTDTSVITLDCNRFQRIVNKLDTCYSLWILRMHGHTMWWSHAMVVHLSVSYLEYCMSHCNE